MKTDFLWFSTKTFLNNILTCFHVGIQTKTHHKPGTQCHSFLVLTIPWVSPSPHRLNQGTCVRGHRRRGHFCPVPTGPTARPHSSRPMAGMHLVLLPPSQPQFNTGHMQCFLHWTIAVLLHSLIPWVPSYSYRVSRGLNRARSRVHDAQELIFDDSPLKTLALDCHIPLFGPRGHQRNPFHRKAAFGVRKF